jgi:glutaconyl-CoA decarboxylase
MKKLRITVGNKSYDVMVEDLTEADSYQTSSTIAPPSPARTEPEPHAPSAALGKPPLSVESGAVISPMAGAIQAVLVKPGDNVDKGQPLVVLEAMKMENQIIAPAAGTVKNVDVQVGDSVKEGHVLLVLE